MTRRKRVGLPTAITEVPLRQPGCCRVPSSLAPIGGTGAAAPLWAGLVAPLTRSWAGARASLDMARPPSHLKRKRAACSLYKGPMPFSPSTAARADALAAEDGRLRPLTAPLRHEEKNGASRPRQGSTSMNTTRSTAPQPTDARSNSAESVPYSITFEPRYVTVSDHTPSTSRRSTHDSDLPEPTSVPCLRLAGKWLRNAGFAEGMRVRIEVSRSRLIIEPIPLLSVPRNTKQRSSRPRNPQ
jgi:hypothetical protein